MASCAALAGTGWACCGLWTAVSCAAWHVVGVRDFELAVTKAALQTLAEERVRQAEERLRQPPCHVPPPLVVLGPEGALSLAGLDSEVISRDRSA